MTSSIYTKSTRGAVWLGGYHAYSLVAEQVHESFGLVRAVAPQELKIETTGIMINVGDVKLIATKGLEDIMENS